MPSSLRLNTPGRQLEDPSVSLRAALSDVAFLQFLHMFDGTVAYERLPSQAGVQLLNRLPNSIKDAPTPKAFKTRLKHFLVYQEFYNAGVFLAFNWEDAQLED
ncbi:hypothetical protein J6590_097014 [Homalodisca vitripennis]|nr:hypothetical protein J6590_097014 [Homalodisca vitripennis]